ncbi:chmp5, partial [Cordylochernes scorpioides]
MKISNKRSLIIELFRQGKCQREIVRLLKVPQQTVSKVIHRYNDLGHEGDRSRRGRKFTSKTSANLMVIKKRLKRNSRVSMRIFARETGIRKSSVHRIAKKELNLKAYKLQNIQLLTKENKSVRLKRCRQLKHRATCMPREHILFMDEKLFTLEQAHNHQNDRSWSTEVPDTSPIVEHRAKARSRTSGTQRSISDALTETVTRIDNRADMLDKKIAKLDTDLVKCKDQIQKMRPGAARDAVRKKALRILRQRKTYEGQRDQLAQQSINIEQTAWAAQTIKDTQLTVSTLKLSAREMKREYRNLNIDEIENLQENLEELLEQSAEVQEVLGRNYGMPDIDEDELDAELDALGDELDSIPDTSYLDAANAPNIPNVTPEINPETTEDDRFDEFGLPKLPA